MKVIIDIPEYTFERIKEYYDALPEGSTVDANVCYIANGTPIPDNATNGDVIRAIFTQWRIIDDADKDMIMFNIPMKVGYEFNACSREWWNASYQKGGKE